MEEISIEDDYTESTTRCRTRSGAPSPPPSNTRQRIPTSEIDLMPPYQGPGVLIHDAANDQNLDDQNLHVIAPYPGAANQNGCATSPISEPEIVDRILRHLSPADLAVASRVCRVWCDSKVVIWNKEKVDIGDLNGILFYEEPKTERKSYREACYHFSSMATLVDTFVASGSGWQGNQAEAAKRLALIARQRSSEGLSLFPNLKTLKYAQLGTHMDQSTLLSFVSPSLRHIFLGLEDDQDPESHIAPASELSYTSFLELLIHICHGSIESLSLRQPSGFAPFTFSQFHLFRSLQELVISASTSLDAFASIMRCKGLIKLHIQKLSMDLPNIQSEHFTRIYNPNLAAALTSDSIEDFAVDLSETSIIAKSLILHYFNFPRLATLDISTKFGSDINTLITRLPDTSKGIKTVTIQSKAPIGAYLISKLALMQQLETLSFKRPDNADWRVIPKELARALNCMSSLKCFTVVPPETENGGNTSGSELIDIIDLYTILVSSPALETIRLPLDLKECCDHLEQLQGARHATRTVNNLQLTLYNLDLEYASHLGSMLATTTPGMEIHQLQVKFPGIPEDDASTGIAWIKDGFRAARAGNETGVYSLGSTGSSFSRT